ncbi:ATP-dependent DNA helicase [Acrasis kona]|uniref:DNA 3'-5' helicase n=1 Tax=Acrasis kona TaxID=1008807 RepID=A0AAW2YY16_9EUKA
MKERIVHLSGKKDIVVGTFHSVAMKILRKHHASANLDSHFAILSSLEQREIVNNILNNLKVESSELNSHTVIEMISTAKNHELSREQITMRIPDVQKLFSQPLPSYFHKIYEHYVQDTALVNKVDYDDLLLLLRRAFQKHPEVRKQVSSEIHHLLVDEFQDTNTLQYKLAIDLCSEHQNIFVVGDPQQTIFTWRHADAKNLDNLRSDFPGALEIDLTHSYRSTQVILDAASHLMSSRVTLIGKPEGDKIVVKQCRNESDERLFVYNTIQELIKSRNLKYKDFAILARTKFMLLDMKSYMEEYNIPVHVHSNDQVSSAEVQQFGSLLSFINGQLDNQSLMNICTLFKLSITILEVILLLISNQPSDQNTIMNKLKNIKQSNINQEEFGRLKSMISFMDHLTSMKQAPITEIVDSIFTLQWSRKTKNFIKNVLTECDDSTLICLLDNIKLSESFNDNERDYQGGVMIATLHASKGLEFDTVFICNCENGSLPFYRAKTSEQVKEEKRLLFVGMTRAKNKLYMTHCAFRSDSRSDGDKPHYQSDFLNALIKQKGELFDHRTLCLKKFSHMQNLDEVTKQELDDYHDFVSQIEDADLVESQFIKNMYPDPYDDDFDDFHSQKCHLNASFESTSSCPSFVKASSMTSSPFVSAKQMLENSNDDIDLFKDDDLGDFAFDEDVFAITEEPEEGDDDVIVVTTPPSGNGKRKLDQDDDEDDADVIWIQNKKR